MAACGTELHGTASLGADAVEPTATDGATPSSTSRAGRSGADRILRPVGITARPGAAFAWLDAARNGPALLVVSAAIAALSTLGAPAGLCLISESLPAGARSTGLAVIYALGISLFGGTTQAAVTALVAWSGDLLWPGSYLALAGAVGAAAAFGLPSEARGPSGLDR